jgi:hypothetical protein
MPSATFFPPSGAESGLAARVPTRSRIPPPRDLTHAVYVGVNCVEEREERRGIGEEDSSGQRGFDAE